MPTPVICVSAAVIVDDDGRVLVVRKRGTTTFMQPGGKADPGETPLSALLRELHEELGVTVSAAQTRPLGRHVAAAANEPGHVVDAELFLVTLYDQPRACAEIDEMRWVDLTAPGDVDLAPLTSGVVRQLLHSAV